MDVLIRDHHPSYVSWDELHISAFGMTYWVIERGEDARLPCFALFT
jgi:hypothetical protein